MKPSRDASDSRKATPRFLPHERALGSRDSRAGKSLPPDLRDQVARRLRLIAIVYALAFFFADLFPAAVTGELPLRFATPVTWLPTVLSIAGGLIAAALFSRPGLSWETRLNLGLGFEVLASYGIASSQYLGIPNFVPLAEVLPVLSPSWVAVWMTFFSIVVPAPPGRALAALIASASSAPLLIGVAITKAGLWTQVHPVTFFFQHVFPYVICVGLAYAGARIVYKLGADVTRARELGSYRLTQRLGRGGMGEVWKASHQMLARPAAIKFIRPESMTGSTPAEAQTMLRRFELEAKATASLTSAHTVNLYDFGVTDDGTFYYVMELLDGLDCERLVRSFGPLEPARVVHLLTQVCESLEEAHERGMIHRDIKPANIYVCRSGKRCDFVKVLDFGLVAHQRPASADLRLTLPEQTMGTPEYMPPEVALGQGLDGRADLYGLGCVAYWLLTGRSAFEGGSFYEIVSKHLHIAPDPPSSHSAHRVPRELDQLVLACLEKSPEQRPADAHELARRLRSIPLAEPWDDDRAESWWREHLPPAGSEGAAGEPEAERLLSR